MWLQILRARFASSPPGLRLTWSLGAGLVVGLLLLPALIYLGGSTVLGKFEGASLAGQYGSVYHGLGQGHWSAWLVILGPALLVLIFHGLQAWWRRSATLAG